MIVPVLESKRLVLKPLSREFLSQKYVDWLNDSDVNKYLESGGDYNLSKLDLYLKDVENKKILFWAINVNNIHIGNIKIDPICFKHHNAEYGIMMGNKKEWGKGYAKEASNLVISYCFEQLKLHKITLGVIEDNLSAVNLYKKLNFKFEGRLVNHVVHGFKFYNVLRMAIFNKNFQL